MAALGYDGDAKTQGAHCDGDALWQVKVKGYEALYLLAQAAEPRKEPLGPREVTQPLLT